MRRDSAMSSAVLESSGRSPLHGLQRASPAYVAEDFMIGGAGDIVCPATFASAVTACRDGCYSGPVRLAGATLDCSSSDMTTDDQDDTTCHEDQILKHLEDICEEEDNSSHDGSFEDGSQHDSLDEASDQEDENDEDNCEGSDASSNLSCGDAGSVIYVAPRETFKCVDELLVEGPEKSSLQPVIEPQQVTLRSSSTDSGVCSQGSPLPIHRASPALACSRDPLPQSSNVSAVVAIDLGTTHSGYAYNVTREPGRQVHVMRRWEGGDSGLVNHKTPTALLLNPEGEFHSFGSSARDAYLDLSASEASQWLFFNRFKMILHHDAELHRDTPIYASNGRTQPALAVFSHALGHLRSLALRELRERCGERCAPDPETVRWVVTVPALWRQSALQLVREAAYQACLCDESSAERLVLVLEPEAAAVQCREQILQEILTNNNGEENIDLPVRYLVADCGGGTVDITLHELSGPSAQLSELVPATGGPYGATGIDYEFEALLDNVFGEDLMEKFRTCRPAAHAELMASFESRKRGAQPCYERAVSIHPPFAFIDFLRSESGKDLAQVVKQHGRTEIEWCSEGVLRLHSSALLQLFSETVDRIVQHVQEVLDSPVLKDRGAQLLFLVGGFSESAVLQDALRESFSHRLQVITPQPSSLATLRGAVLYGLEPTVVAARRAPRSYGVGVVTRFLLGVHPDEKLVVSRDGGRWCADMLDSLVVAGEPLMAGFVATRRYAAASSGQRHAILHVYSAELSQDRETPQFVTDNGVTRCGTLTLALNSKQDEENTSEGEVQAQLFFSGAELVVSATCVRTGHSVHVHLDFLAHHKKK